MSNLTEAQIQSAYISFLRSQPSVTILVSGTEIREAEYQAQDFSYPNIRVAVDVYPSLDGCGTDRAEIFTEAYSAQKSSLESKNITGAIYQVLHKRHFHWQGIDFAMTRVVKIDKSIRSIYAWKSAMLIEVLVA